MSHRTTQLVRSCVLALTAVCAFAVACTSRSASEPRQLRFDAQPVSTTAGDVLPAMRVVVAFPSGIIDRNAAVSVTISIDTNPGGGTLLGTTTVPATNGEAVFSDLRITQAGSGYTLRATAAGINDGISTSFNILAVDTPLIIGVLPDPGPAVLSGPVAGVYSAEVALGQPLGFRVTISHTIPGETVTASVAATGGALSLAQAGFDQPLPGPSGPVPLDLVLTGTAATVGTIELTITVEDTASVQATGELHVRINGPASTGFTTQPTDTEALGVITPAVEVSLYDANGHRVLADGINVAVSIETNAGSPPGSLSGTTVVSTVAGVASFPTLSLDQVGVGYRLQADSAGLPPAVSSFFDITGIGNAPYFTSVVAESGPAVITGPSGGVATIEVALGQPLDFRIRASHGNAGEQLSATVAVTGGGLTAAGAGFDQPFPTPTGTPPLDVLLTGTATTVGTIELTLDVADESDVHDTLVITLQINDASALAWAVAPFDFPAVEPFDPPLEVEVVDANGHRVLVDGVSVSLSFGVNAGSPPGQFLGQVTDSTVAGVAVFDNLWITEPGEGYTLVASAAGFPPIESPPFDVLQQRPEVRLVFLRDYPAGCIEVEYWLEQADSVPADVFVEFDPGDGNWRPATPAPTAPGEEGWLARSTAPDPGVMHVWHWDSTRDLPAGSGAVSSRLRVTATLPDGASGFRELNNVKVYNGHTLTPVLTQATLGQLPRTAQAVDVNGDGALDLVFGNRQSDDVSIFIQSLLAPGTFEPERRYATGDSTADVAVADVNGDDRMDLVVVAENDDVVNVWLHHPVNSLEFVAGPSLPINIDPQLVEVADLDGDDRPEIIVTTTDFPLSVRVFWQDPAPAAPGSFSGPDLLALNRGPNDLIVADLNGDNLPDIATSTVFDSVEVILQDAANPGTFLAAQAWTAGSGTWSVRAGDIDGDGPVDLVVANNSGLGFCTVLWGSAAQPGSFPDRTTIPMSKPYVADLRDMDGDGRVDIVAVSTADDVLLVARQTAPRTFRQSYIDGTGAAPFAFALADFTGDGLADVVVPGRDSNEFTIWRNDGARPCGEPLTAGQGFRPRANWNEMCTIGDVNNDGKPDVLAVERVSAVVEIDYGDGAGGFVEGTSIPTAGCWSIASADLDRDGNLDVVVGDSTETRVALGNGDGTFGPFTAYAASGRAGVWLGDTNGDGWLDIIALDPGNDFTVWLQDTGLPGTFFLHHTDATNREGMQIGDVTGDGHPDLVWFVDQVNPVDDDLHIQPGDGNGRFGSEIVLPLGGGEASRIALGDLDADGVSDIVVLEFAPVGWQLSSYLSTGGGSFSSLVVMPSVDAGPDSLAIADIDLDGFGDLLARGATTLEVFVGDGAGGLTGQGPHVVGSRGAINGIADFNGDRQPDALLDDYLLLQSPGSPGTWDDATVLPATDPEYMRESFPTDFDNDGTTDVAVRFGANDGSGVVQIFRQDPAEARSFSDHASVVEPAGNVDGAAIVDVDGNDLPDVLLVQGSLDRLRVWRQDGANPGTFLAVETWSTGDSPRCLAAADLDQDNAIDVVIGDSSNEGISVHFGNGDGSFGARVPLSTDLGVEDVKLVDLNGDGWLDIVAISSSTNRVNVLLQIAAAPGTFEPNVEYVAGQVQFRFGFAVGDLNADGRPDVAVANGDDDTLTVLMQDAANPGTLLAPITIPLPGQADSVTIADVNRDQRADLVCGSWTASFGSPLWMVLDQDPDTPGTFAAPRLLASGLRPDQPSAVDLDADGFLDLLLLRHSGPAPGGPAIHWGR